MDRMSRLLLGGAGLLAAAVIAYGFVPLSDGSLQVWYDVAAAAAMLLGALGVAHHRPAHRRGWVLILVGYGGWVLGDLVWDLEQHLLPGRFPAPSDAVYLGSYVVLGAGALILARTRRSGRGLAAFLDASIIAGGAAVLAAVFVIAPLAADSSLSMFGKIVSSAYPVGDLFLLGVVVRMFSSPGARTASYRMLVSSLVATLSADIAWNIYSVVTGDTGSPRWTDMGWLASYVLVGAAACVPSMRTVAEPAPEADRGRATLRRLALLTLGLTLPAVALLIEGATGRAVLWPVIGTGTVVLSALVLARMAGLLNTVQVQAVQLAALARSDALTGAPNRRTWDHELSRACLASREEGTPLSVAVLDLDRFKAYNDQHGHQAGDRLLREAVAAWGEALGGEGLLARYGGEEFAVLLPGLDTEEALAVIQRLRVATPLQRTFSAGVAGWDPQTEPGTVVACADQALYQAKRTGRDRIVVHGTSGHLTGISGDLPAITMVVQPIVEIATRRVVGHEALARFAGPHLDVQRVFQRAHRDGYGDLLELSAVRAALSLPDRPSTHELYVNVSTTALASARFWAGLPMRLDGVVVELGEDQEILDVAVLASHVRRLRARGARIALDDLGAGAGEFSRLSALRPDVVKIDRSVVDGCASDTGRSAVIRALATYAEHLGATVCAEGVETQADLEHLAAVGIAHAQGYLFARPGRDWQVVVGAAARFTDLIGA